MSFIEIDMLLLVIHKKNSDLKDVFLQSILSLSNKSSQYNAFDPFKKAGNLVNSHMPNILCAWCDPNWSGISVDAYYIDEKNEKKTECVIFHLCGKIVPSFTHCGFEYQNLDESIVSVCNSMKVHFFYSNQIQRNGFKDTKRDFLYSSAFPLFQSSPSNMLDLKNSMSVYGLFNFNTNEEKCTLIDNARLVVCFLKPTRFNVDTIQILKIWGPSNEHNETVLTIAHWFEITLKIICPSNSSAFSYIRTICRDYGNSILFQHLTLLFRNPIGSRLPMEIVFYCVFNSLIVNNINLDHMLSKLNAGSDLNSTDVQPFLRLLRDSIVPWTMCVFEGLYMEDTSLQQNVEDQPFPCSFFPSRRVFQKDDCEGRVSEGQQMADAFKSLYLFIKENASKNYENDIESCIAHIATMYSKTSVSDVTRLNLKMKTWNKLIHLCFHIGFLFFTGILEMHTCVGDVNFTAFNSDTALDPSKNEANLGGHSFAILLFNHKRGKQFCTIIEATGWERNILSSDKSISKYEMFLLKQMTGIICKKHKDILVCGHLSDERENRMYTNICLGNDCIFFDKKEALNNGLNYGIPLSAFKSNIVKTIPRPIQSDPQEIIPGDCIRISTPDFIKEILNAVKYINKQVEAKPLFIKQKIIDENNIDSTVINHLNKAMDIKILYQRYFDAIPMIRRCIGTPNKSRYDYLSIMKKSWAILNESDFNEYLLSNDTIQCQGFYFTVLNNQDDNYIDNILKDMYAALEKRFNQSFNLIVKKHHFMQSIIVNVCVAEQSQK